MAIGATLPEGFTVDAPQAQANDNLPQGFVPDAPPNPAQALPDMAGVHAMAEKNLAEQNSGEGAEKKPEAEEKQEEFGPKLDRAAGMPVTAMIGKPGNDMAISAQMRGHLVDAYANGKAVDAGDYFQNAVPSLANFVKGYQLPLVPTAKAAWQGVEAGIQNAKNFATMANLPTPVADEIKAKVAAGKPVDWKDYLGKFNESFQNSPGGQAMGVLFNTTLGAVTPTFEAARDTLQEAGIPPQVTDFILNVSPLFHHVMPKSAKEIPAEEPHPDLRAVVANTIHKPVDAVTNTDIAQAIRMGFEDKAPKAKDFHDTAAVMESPPVLYSRRVEGDSISVMASNKENPSILDTIGSAKVSKDETGAYGLHLLEVSPKEQRRGIGTQLMDEIYAALPEGAKIRAPLTTKAGEAFLKNFGLEKVGWGASGDLLSKEDYLRAKKKTEPKKTVDTLHDIYKETGVAPDQVFADAQKDPKVAEEVKAGKIPEVYEHLREKLDSANEDLSAIKQGLTTNKKTSAPELGAPEGAEPVAGKAESAPQKRAAEPVTKKEHAKVLERRDLSPEHQELESKLGAPESMSVRQLNKAETALEDAFAEEAKNPKASDEQYTAMEDFARRIEAAREGLKTPLKDLIQNEAGELKLPSIPDSAKELMDDIKRDVLNFTTPMETGSDRARASAKDFANEMRFAQWNGARILNLLKDEFTPEELTSMWEAMDKASVHAQTLESNGMSRDEAMAQTEKDNVGHFALPEKQREIIKAMSEWAQHSWDQAKSLGMVDGEGLPFWTPRMAAMIGEDGKWGSPSGEGPRPSVNVGKNLRTTSGNLKNRKYLTAEETEAAMKEAFGGESGEDAKLVRDIRTMPLALSRLNQAIAGRSLIDQIKKMGKDTGAETTSGEPRDGYFTLDHPAFQTYKPKLKLNEEGKWEIQKDAEGNDLFEKTPIYISKEFEGPLKAVLSQNSSATYKALMQLKGKSMGMIMYSPLIHNAVEWGRALPAMPGKVTTFKVYFEGNRAKNDPVQMKEAINAGLVPIGARFFNQDISSIVEEPNLTPGRSWTAKLLGGLVGEVHEGTGNKVKAAIDKMGDVWHNTLLWDRVADLQMGLYTNIRDQALKNGMDPQGAQSVAAHVANRFAGALPMESMSNTARKLANITMFSRSFTIGNLGVMKDALAGLPSDVKAQLKRDIGEQGTKSASKMARRKAQTALLLDIGLMYAGNSLLQDALDHMKRDKTWGQIAQGYVDRMHKLMQKHAESPWELLNVRADLQALSSTASNEPGKQNRIHFSDDPKTGTAYYLRLPTGKIGEEFEGWLTSPLEMARKKVSPLLGPLIDTYRNADYFGHPIYDKDARGFSGSAESLGKVVKHFMEAQIPEDSIISAYKSLTGSSHEQALDTMKTVGPLAGVTFSPGYPGGPEAGILASASRRQEAQISTALPKVKEAVQAGDEDKARQIMDKLNMTTRQQNAIINHYANPADKVNARSKAKFDRIATPEEKDLMEEQGQ